MMTMTMSVARDLTPADDDAIMRFRAVSAQTNRLGYMVTATGWQLDAYMRNPVFLFGHDYSIPPIGRVVRLEVDDNGLLADVIFDRDDDLARTVERKYRAGFLTAVSVGFDPLEAETGEDGIVRITRKELLEISSVAVPADPEALRVASRFCAPLLADRLVSVTQGAIAPHVTPKAPEDRAWDADAELRQAEGRSQLRRMHAYVVDDANPDAKSSYKLPHHLASGEVVWRGVAAAMARLMQSRTDIPDSARPGVWRHLATHYRQFNREPPPMEERSVEIAECTVRDDAARAIRAWLEARRGMRDGIA